MRERQLRKRTEIVQAFQKNLAAQGRQAREGGVGGGGGGGDGEM